MNAVPGPPKCPLCPRARRVDRPICNHHMRKAGQPNLDAYFVQSREARGKPANSPEVRALGATIDNMLAACREYDHIKACGYKPHWDAGLGCWRNPWERARAILTHRIGNSNPEFLDMVADELVPRTP